MFGLRSITRSVSPEFKGKIIKKFKKEHGVTLYDIRREYPDSSSNYLVTFYLTEDVSFGLSQIPSQCGWLTMGKYENMEDSDFYVALTILEVISCGMGYAGMYVTDGGNPDWLDILLDCEFHVVTELKNETLLHKEINYG